MFRFSLFSLMPRSRNMQHRDSHRLVNSICLCRSFVILLFFSRSPWCKVQIPFHCKSTNVSVGGDCILIHCCGWSATSWLMVCDHTDHSEVCMNRSTKNRNRVYIAWNSLHSLCSIIIMIVLSSRVRVQWTLMGLSLQHFRSHLPELVRSTVGSSKCGRHR